MTQLIVLCTDHFSFFSFFLSRSVEAALGVLLDCHRLEYAAAAVGCEGPELGCLPPPPSLHPPPSSLLPTPSSLLPTPSSLHPPPYTLLPTPSSLLPLPPSHLLQQLASAPLLVLPPPASSSLSANFTSPLHLPPLPFFSFPLLASWSFPNKSAGRTPTGNGNRH